MEEVKHRYEYFLKKHFSTYQIILLQKSQRQDTCVITILALIPCTEILNAMSVFPHDSKESLGTGLFQVVSVKIEIFFS